MSQRRGKKRTFAESEEGIDVKSIYKLTNKKRKKRRTNRTLPKLLQQKLGKATSAYINKDLETAKALAQEIVKEQPKYPDIYDLLGKINEEQEDYSNALTAYQYYITLRFPQKTIQSETSRNLFKDNNAADSDSDFDDDQHYKNNKNPTPQLIEKIAKLALKSQNDDMALTMITMMETHYKRIINKINDPKNRDKIAMNHDELQHKKQEIMNYLLNIYRKRASIYAKLKRSDEMVQEYELIYTNFHKTNHPLIVSQVTQPDITQIEVDANHEELLRILKQICPKAFNHTSYLYLFNYFDIFMKDEDDSNPQYLLWLMHAMSVNTSYRVDFYELLGRFVGVGMEMFRFKAILKFLQFFGNHLSDTFWPFVLNIKKGICLLWIDRIQDAMEYYNDLIAVPQETMFGPLYMLFLDALIAKNMMIKAQYLMNIVQKIAHFDKPRIWLRFADCYTLQKQYDKAIKEYSKVIDTVTATAHAHAEPSEEDQNVLLSARLKLLEIYFIEHDEENAKTLLKTIEKYKEEHFEMNSSSNDMEIKQEDEDTTATVTATATATTAALKPQKRVRLNPRLTSYFNTGLFGSVLVPKQLLHLELLNIELRSQYLELKQLFNDGKYVEYLEKCEAKIIELFAICHSAPQLRDTVYECVYMKNAEECGLTLGACDEEQQIGAVVMSKYHLEKDVIAKYSQIVSINDENVSNYKLDEIKQILDTFDGEIAMKIKFIIKQNIFPVLRCDMHHDKIYCINHLGHVLKDACMLKLMLFVCKIWYLSSHVSSYNLFKEIQVMVSIMDEAASSINPHKLEFDHFEMAELHLLMANIYFNQNDIESCYHELVYVLDLQPNNVNAMRYLYEMYRHLSHHPKIERTIKRQLTNCKRNAHDDDDDNDHEMVWHQLILAHTSFSKNSYDIAANTYSRIITKYKHSPFMHLMLAITFLQHAMKRTTKQEKYLVTIQGIAFIKRYVKLAKNTTQSLYNFARAFHLLALYGCAQILYEKIIHRIRFYNTQNTRFNPIRRYAAYNLSKIYLRSGQYDLAIKTLKENIIV